MRSRAEELYDQLTKDGVVALDRLIAEQVSEELFVDYKRSANDVNDSKLHYSDRENLARAIAGFANSEGGIVIWGLDCRKDPQRGDVPGEKHPIHDAKRFASYLEGATSGCTLPPHDGVRHHVITEDAARGFVVTFVPKSMFAPHQCIVGKYRDRYYMRVGSNFELASHGLLAGMFGRQPIPNIFHMWGCGGAVSPASWAPLVTHKPTSTPYVWVEFIIANQGIALARDIYVNLKINLPGQNCSAEVTNVANGWTLSESLGIWHLMSVEGYRLPPAASVKPIAISMYLSPPFVDPVSIEVTFGCAGSQVQRVDRTVDAGVIRDAVRDFVASDRTKPVAFEFACRILGFNKSDASPDS